MPHPEYDLLSNRFLNRLLKSRFFIFSLRLIFVVLFIGLVYAGLYGGIYRNIASAFTGIIWLVAISLFTVLFGKVWCTVCPWNTIADLIRLKLRTITGKFPDAPQHESSALSLSKTIPIWLKNLWFAMISLAILVLIEYSVGITHNPRMTAYVALAMLALAIIFGLLFTRKSFCRYCCPVGIMSGLYALFAPFELRSVDKNICAKCQTKDCIKGNTKGAGCPVFEFPAEMKTNANCILCTECIKTCPYDNIGINLRPFGRDIGHITREFTDKAPERKRESLLIIMLILFSIFHNFYTTQIGAPFNDYLLNTLKLNQFWIAGIFTTAIFILSVIIFSVFKNSIAYFYAFLPLQMLTHLGLTIKQLSQNIDGVTWASTDPLGMNRNIFGITSAPKFIFDAVTIWKIEIGLGIIGFLFGVYFIINIAKAKASRSKLSFALSLFILSALLILNILISRV